MELKHFLWWFIMLVLFSLCINGCFGCLEEERIALLQLKASINYPNGSSLSYWDDSTNKLNDCCQWKRLECNNTTRRVIRLDLGYVRGYRLGNWHLNASLFLPFRELNYLDLTENRISGWVPNEGFNRFSRLNKLEVLLLDYNRFNDSFLSSISAVASLKELYLTYNQLDQQISLPELGRLNNLKELYLDHSYIEKSFLQRAGNMTSLDVLAMRDCRLNGSLPTQGELPRWMGNMSSLREIAMADNQLKGPIPRELCKLDLLMFLDLSENNLSGSIPFNCFNSSFLRHVHLNKNRLSGPIRNAFKDSLDLVTLDLTENRLTGYLPDWIGNLSSLSILLLKANHLQGRIQNQLCLLAHLSILDLSHNNLSGLIPHCLSNITFELTHKKSFISNEWYEGYYPLGLKNALQQFKTARLNSPFQGNWYIYYANPGVEAQQEVEFTTKRRSYSYKGNILDYMSGIDLSCNSFSGGIPAELGKLSNIHALNLSFNNLTGSIPMEFSGLEQIESLDLSYNNLNGIIPSQLIELHSLAVFSVAYNNLSGTTPERKDQFGTFDESSYEGNPLLCGPPLVQACRKNGAPSAMPADHEGEESDSFTIDMVAFNISFAVSYAVVLMTIAGVLYINPYWRQAWFYFIEVCITNFYCFVVINFRRLSNFI